MMAQNDWPHGAKRLQWRTQRVAYLWMTAHHCELFGGQLGGLQQNRIRHADFANVVKITATAQGMEVVGTKPKRVSQLHGEPRQPFTMSVRVRIACFDRQRQRDKRRFC